MLHTKTIWANFLSAPSVHRLSIGPSMFAPYLISVPVTPGFSSEGPLWGTRAPFSVGCLGLAWGLLLLAPLGIIPLSSCLFQKCVHSCLPPPGLFVAKGSFVLKEPFLIILMGSWEGKETLRLPVLNLIPKDSRIRKIWVYKLRQWSASWLLQISDISSKKWGENPTSHGFRENGTRSYM